MSQWSIPQRCSPQLLPAIGRACQRLGVPASRLVYHRAMHLKGLLQCPILCRCFSSKPRHCAEWRVRCEASLVVHVKCCLLRRSHNKLCELLIDKHAIPPPSLQWLSKAEAEGGLEAAFTAPFIRQSATFVSQQAAQWYEHQSIRKHTFDGAISQADAAAAKKLGAQAARQVDQVGRQGRGEVTDNAPTLHLFPGLSATSLSDNSQAGASVTGATVVATRLQQQFPSLPSKASQQETLYGRSDASRQDPGTEASGSAAAKSSPRPDGNEQTDTAGVESLVAGSTALHACFQSDGRLP